MELCQSKQNIAIFSSLNYHYEMFGYIIHFCYANDYKLTIFADNLNSCNDWLGYYKDAVPGTETYVPFNHLAPQTLYHWRIRMRYHPVTTPFMPASRWFSAPWNGMNEADFRSGSARLLLPLILRP